MATLFRKSYFSLRAKRIFRQLRVPSWCNGIKCGERILKNSLALLMGTGATCGAFLYFLDRSVQAMEQAARVPSYPWVFEGYVTSLDHAAVRRGWQVYKSVCCTCHSLRYVRFMDLVDVSHTSEEAKAIAAEHEFEDGPDEEGNYYMRPGKLSDTMPLPFPNENAARAANFGSYPPDLTYFIWSRRNGRNYTFSLLTGWMEPPAGVSVADHQHFNIYFPGNIINMPQMLTDGVVEYDDGTPSTVSQMAKDMVEFLSWTSSQNHDRRKQMFVKMIGIAAISLVSLSHYFRYVWSHVRTRQIAFVPKKKH